MFLETNELSKEQKEDILALWNREYPVTLQYTCIEDFETYLERLSEPHHYLVVHNSGKVEGWAFTFIRDNEKWFAIILDEKLQGKSLGSILLGHIKQNETILNGWVSDQNIALKSNGDIYRSPLQFYIKNDFTVCSDVRLETDKLSAVKIKWERGNI